MSILTRKKMDMTTGSIPRLLITFAIPLLLGNLFQQFYNTVDSLIVGRVIGKEALAAIGATSPICKILVNFFNGVSIGAGVLISQNFGAKDDEAMHRSIETTMGVTFVCCVLFTIIGYIGTPYLLLGMNTPDDVLPFASMYLKIYFLGITGLLIYNMGSSILRAVGDSTRPLIYLMICSGMNVILDLLFVVAFRNGIAGVAVATVLSQGFSAALILYLLMTTTENYRFNLKETSLDTSVVNQIISYGLPTGIQQSVTALSNVFVQGYVNAFQSDVMAGFTAYLKLDQFLLLPIMSMANACTTFVGQNIGAKDIERSKKGAATGLRLSLLTTLVLGTLMWLASSFLVSLFNTDEAVVSYGTLFLRTNIPCILFCCFNQVLAGVLRGVGKSKVPMYALILCQVILRQIYLALLKIYLPGNVRAVVFAFPFGWATCALILVIYYFRMDWKKVQNGDGGTIHR